MSVDSGMQPPLGYPRFRELDLAYPDRLLLKLRDARDPVSEYIRRRCDSDMARLIELFDRLPSEAEVKRKVLVNGLNRFVEDPELFDEDRFAQVNLRNETQKLLTPKLNYEELLRRNRLLIEDAYAEEIGSSSLDFSTAPDVPTTRSVEASSSTSQAGGPAKVVTESNGFNNPFPGLRPFETNEYHLFFGRDGQSDELIERLGRTHFLAVVGTSGSGKSSLVRAGLLPALYGGLMAQASSSWRVALFRPGDDPLGNLASALGAPEVLGVAGAEVLVETAMIETTLRRSALGLIDAVRQARLADHESVLVVVDQFEELFRFRDAIEGPEDDATAFVKLLLEAGAQREMPIYVVITMRSDYLGDCAQFWDLPKAINLGQYLIPRMTRDERREAITGPVAVAGGGMTVPLINRLLNDVGDNPDQLPILQHALMRSWNHWQQHKRNGQPIDIRDYEAVGGMERALSNHANEAYGELSAPQQKIAAKVFKALTEKGTDNREIRHPVPLRELCAIAAASEQEVVSIIETFRRGDRSFLMPPHEVTLDADTVIDISHESLIRNWSVLERWVGEEAESARMYRRLADATKAFGGSYLPDSLLDSALEWRERNQPNAAWAHRHRPADEAEVVFEEVMAFIDGSRDARIDRIKEDELRQNEEAVRQRRELEQAAELAEKELRLAETERERAVERAATQQRELESANIFAAQQALTATRLRRYLVAMCAFALIALAGAGVAVYAFQQARTNLQQAKESEKRTLVEKGRADEAKTKAETLAGQLQTSLDQLQIAKGRADTANDIATKALITAKSETRRANETAANLQKEIDSDKQNRAAFALIQRGDMKRAEERFKQLQTRYANDESRLPFVLTNLGTAQQALEKPEAEASFKYALAILEKKFKHDEPELLDAVTGLAHVYAHQRKYKEAVDQYERVLTIREGILGKENPELAGDIENLAQSLERRGDYNENDVETAETLYKRAVALRRLTGDKDKLVQLLNTVARFYDNLLYDDDAVPFYEEVAKIQEERLEPDDLELAASYNNLGLIYADLASGKRNSNTIPVIRTFPDPQRLFDIVHAIQLRKRTPRPDEGMTEAGDLNDLALLYVRANKDAQAQKVFQKELEVLKDGGEQYRIIDVLNRLADLARNQHHDDEAKSFYDELFDLVGGDSGGEKAAKARMQRGYIEFQQKKYKEAEASYRQALSIRQAESEPSDSLKVSMADDAFMVAESLFGQAKVPTAEGYFKQALAGYDELVRSDRELKELTDDKAKALAGEGLVSIRLAELYQSQGKRDESKQMSDRAVNALKVIHTTRKAYNQGAKMPYLFLEVYWDYLRMIEGLGRFYSGSGDYQSAGQIYFLLDDNQPPLEPNEALVGLYESYAGVLEKMNRLQEMKAAKARAQAIREKLKQLNPLP